MKCEYCERTFENNPYKRVVRGKEYIYCGEGCFNLWIYKWPKLDIDAMYKALMCPVPSEVYEEVFKEDIE